MSLRERAAEDGEVLAEDIDRPAVDPGMSRDDPVPEHLLGLHLEVGAPVGHEPVELDERPLVHEEVDALASGELPLRMLGLDALLTSTDKALLAHAAETVQGGL